MAQNDKSVPLSDAALRLGVSYWSARDLLLKGRLHGGRDARGRFVVDLQSVERLFRERARRRQP